MAKKKVEIEDGLEEETNEEDYQYLVEASEAEEAGIQMIGTSFYRVTLGGTNDSKDEATGQEISAKKYNAPGFPGFNYDNIFVIPLIIQPERRVLYTQKYDGQSRPPDCWSPDGLEAAIPGQNIMGVEVGPCGPCEFAIYGSEPSCRPKPAIYGLAIFNVGGKPYYVPVHLDVATMSREQVKNIDIAVRKTVVLNGEPRRLAPFARIIKCGRTLITSKKGPVTAWTMSLLNSASQEVDPEEGLPIPNFTPAEIIKDIKSFQEAAFLANNAMIKPVTMLPSGGPPPKQLPGGTAGGSVDAQTPVEVGAETF